MDPDSSIRGPLAGVSVTLPVSLALERVKQVLFRPFDLGRWFVIGFCAWLSLLGQNGFGGGGGGGPGSGGGQDGGGANPQLENISRYVMENLVWLAVVAALVLVLVVALMLLFNWVSSRGRFMFLHCVALNRAEVKLPWRLFAREAGSLFWFRLCLGLIWTALVLPLVALIGVLIFGMVDAGEVDAVRVTISAATALVFLAVMAAYLLIRQLTMDFVVPIMFLRHGTCLEGWRELRGLLAGNVGRFIRYVLFRILLAMAIAAMLVIAVFATCCIAGCLMALPYVGTVLLLPVHVFNRAYSAHYLAQFGRTFNVFPSGPEAAPG